MFVEKVKHFLLLIVLVVILENIVSMGVGLFATPLVAKLNRDNIMKIFISYSTPDINLVQLFGNSLSSFGEIKYWAKDNIPGSESWETIFSWIDNSDVVLVLITGNTVSRAMSVGQEVGRAKTKNRLIIPIVEKSIPSTELGFLSGITYQPIDLSNPLPAVNSITQIVQHLSIDKTQKQNAALILAALGFFIWLLSEK